MRWSSGLEISAAPPRTNKTADPMNLCLDTEAFPTWFGLPAKESLPATHKIDYVHYWRCIGGSAAVAHPAQP
jgi:hypothetical protein